MASSRVPGPTGSNPAADSHTPRPVGLDNPAPLGGSTNPTPITGSPHNVVVATASAINTAPAENTAADVTDPQIEALKLSEVARKAAYLLKKAHPSVKFTSGRRGKEDQARAMASNVVKNRKWIEQTYRASEVSGKCQRWVDDHPEKKTQAEIQEGLLSVLNSVTPAELARISKHLSGDAFDVQPLSDGALATAIKQTIEGLPGKDKFLEKEGGLVRWHVQFK
jgi:hypothetical protein